MLHLAGRCMPTYSHTKLGREGNAIFKYGPIAIYKGNDLSCVVMSSVYADALEQYIESLALTPLIMERGSLSSVTTIGVSSHTGQHVTAVGPAVEEWKQLSSDWKGMYIDIGVRKIGREYYGPSPVLNYPGYAFVQASITSDFSSVGTDFTVYFVFRKNDAESTLIGILAGYRKGGKFDPVNTGKFVSPDALKDLIAQDKLDSQKPNRIGCAIAPTQEETQTDYYKDLQAQRRIAINQHESS